ncbi:unnamed protein product, partial [Iphiclides podalirius]
MLFMMKAISTIKGENFVNKTSGAHPCAACRGAAAGVRGEARNAASCSFWGASAQVGAPQPPPLRHPPVARRYRTKPKQTRRHSKIEKSIMEVRGVSSKTYDEA